MNQKRVVRARKHDVSADRVETIIDLDCKCGEVLDIGECKKLKEGKELIQFFSTPEKLGGDITLWGVEPTYYRSPEKNERLWEQFKYYNKRDVEAERAIRHRLSKFPLPDSEFENWRLSEIINDRGCDINQTLLQGASIIVEKEKKHLAEELRELTSLVNPNSPIRFLEYVRKHGYTFTSINKAYVKRGLEGECPNLDEDGRKALTIRLQLAKTGVSKLDSCRAMLSPDGKIRHMFIFMGAARTGRFTGGIFQPTNISKASAEVDKKLDLALDLLKAADYEGIKANFSSPLDVATAALRPLLVPPEGHKFLIADLSAIETRGSAWLADCPALTNIFKEGLDPYLSFAVQLDGVRTYQEMYHEWKVLGNKKNRNEAKPPVLGCCYSLGPGEITYDSDGNKVATGLLGYAAAMGIELTQEFAIKAVEVFRRSYPEVVQAWWDLHRAFVDSVENDSIVETNNVVFELKGRVLCVKLPSGRNLHYVNPSVSWTEAVSRKGNKYRKSTLWYDGVDQKTKMFGPQESRGPKIFENIVQAVSRDILCEGIKNAENKGLPVHIHCHDELVVAVPIDSKFVVEDLIECMTRVPDYLPGFLISAEGYESNFYRKE